MLVYEEEFDEIIRGSAAREVILKRHIFEDKGKFYIYSSSVPDQIYPDEDKGDASTRFDVLHHTICFE